MKDNPLLRWTPRVSVTRELPPYRDPITGESFDRSHLSLVSVKIPHDGHVHGIDVHIPHEEAERPETIREIKEAALAEIIPHVRTCTHDDRRFEQAPKGEHA